MAPRLLPYDEARKLPPAKRTAGSLYWSAVSSMTVTLKSCRCCNFAFCGGMTRIRQNLLAEDVIRACAYVNADKDVQMEFLQIKVKAQARRGAEKATAARKSKTTDEEVAADAARAHANRFRLH